MSPLMFSNPARRASAKAARAWAALWGRPRVRSWASLADWTPRESRLTPAALKPRSRSSVTVSGLASRVISAPAGGRQPGSGGRPGPGSGGWGCRRRSRRCPGGPAGHRTSVPAPQRQCRRRGRPAGRRRYKNHSTGSGKSSREYDSTNQKTKSVTAFS